ncbi:MAG TPA: prolyl oligopeptidase family serine peptidase [Vicinamibacterales bacterium]|nr:prolyl oligopeptidase family serine peptidase [Vicinamibacterales bacterium]
MIAPYGTWKSPLTAARVTAGSLRFDHIVLDGDDLYWVEGRASEGGRNVIVCRSRDGAVRDITPADFNVRTRVHEYGGAAYTVDDGTVYFSNFADQKMYRQARNGSPQPLTAAGYLYADSRLDPKRERLIVVREDHTAPGEPVNTIVSVPTTPTGPGPQAPDRVLVSGADFYSDPILNPAGDQLAWLQWDHPNMPWDGTELWLADVAADGSLITPRRVASGDSDSIFQPEWSPDGTLFFVSDRTGYWNLYRLRNGGVDALLPMAADFGKAQWTFSMTTYAFASSTRIVATYVDAGRWHCGVLDIEDRTFERLALGLEPFESIRVRDGQIYFIGGAATRPSCIAAVSLADSHVSVLRTSTDDEIDPAWVSAAEAVSFRSDGADVYAFYYAPKNPECAAPAGDRPPLLVLSHGGPTTATSGVLDARLQFWTSRGFAILDVNYGGSTGYGRAYRDRLKGQWGLVDVADCVNGAKFLVAAGYADPNRLMIHGGSAGGYTTLAALTFHDTFQAGASYYGISDIEVLAQDTHKFESRYLDSLVGPYPAARDVYRARSPIHFTERLSCALILFQGLEDQVVPPNQSEMMAAAVRKKGLPVAYVPFAGEQHGFRKAENIIRSLEAELYFYGAVFGFVPADPIEPVAIDNLLS